jgi:hypothetical protein
LVTPTRASRGSGYSLLALAHVDVNTRSNALYDRCATGTRVPVVSPTTGKHAGQRAMRLVRGSGSHELLAEPWESMQS